jgi:glucan phosphoethanolaminetransferase (alkaline phosphatase superfamily)
LSWLPVLWGQDKPFICTPKQEVVRTKRTVWMANISALPKLLFILNVITAVIVAPFSSLYSPLLFIFAVTVCFLKLWSAKVMLTNYGYIEPNAANIAVAHYHEEVVNKVVVRKPSQLRTTSFTKSKGSSSELPFKDDNIVNF